MCDNRLRIFLGMSRTLVRSSWATKVSEIGQQALVGAEGAKESQGRKDHGIPATLPRRQRLWDTTKAWLGRALRDLGQQDPWICH